MRRLAFVISWLLAGIAAADTYTIDPQHSHIGFSVRHLLGTARGEFHRFNGTIQLDRDAPERSSVSVTIQVASIDTKIRNRDDHLLSAEFFNAKQFPTIIFRSRSVTRTGPNKGDIAGELTMKGVTRPLKLHVELVTPASQESLPSRTRWMVTSEPIRRADFALVFSNTAETLSGIGREVVPAITIEAVRE